MDREQTISQVIRGIYPSIFDDIQGMDKVYEGHTATFPRKSSLYMAFKNNQHETSPPAKNRGFGRIFKEFGQNTSFHGLKFVTDSDTLFLKRLIWLLVMLTCAGLLIWQIVDRVLYYYELPVTVNVRINYNKTLEFPLVTICNQNAFKTTSATEEKQYKLLEKMFTEREKFDYNSLAGFDAENITLMELYNKTAHRKDDFIFRCTWKGKTCNPEDFTTVATDHGICYTFNIRGSDEHISSPGVENGLRLTLNVEQYEYMPGPHDAAGVKMLLHDLGELPRVHALGQAIPTGAHVVVGVKVLIVQNLKQPYGQCRNKVLQYVDKYSVEACELDCLTQVAKERCGCRNIYMPHRNGDPPVCTLKEHYSCMQNVEDTFRGIKHDRCDCPVPCRYYLYEPDISYASTSQYAIGAFLSSADRTELSKSLIFAKEVSSKMVDSIFEHTKEISADLESSVENIEKLLLTDLSDVVSVLTENVNSLYTEIESAYLMKEFLYRFQIYIVNKNFIRARDAMEERTIHMVVTGYMEYIFSVENKIRSLADVNFTDVSARFVIYQITMEMLNNRQKIVNMAYDNYTTLVKAYDTGQGIFNYSFEGLSRRFNSPATPRLLIQESRIHNDYAVKYGERYGRYLNRTVIRLDWLKDLVDIAYFNSSLDEERLNYCREEFRWYMRNFLFARSVFYSETIEWPIGILENKEKRFTAKWNEYQTLSETVEQNLKSMKLQVDGVDEYLLQPLHNLHDIIHEYIHGDSYAKYNISQIVTSASIQNGILNFKTFFQQVRSRETNIIDALSRMQTDVIELFTDIYEDKDAIEYYDYTGKEEFLRNISDVIENVNMNFTKLKRLSEFSNLINNSDALFIEVLDNVIEDGKQFIQSVQVDNSFIRNNFLKMDIFYRQMSYEEIEQQIAYDIFGLVCDIGGSMGLFLGASLLSIFEIIDLLVSHIALRQTSRRIIHVKKVPMK